MEFKKNRLLLAATVGMALGLSGCGGGDDDSSGDTSGLFGDEGSTGSVAGSGTGTTTTGSTVNPAHTIVLTYPVTDAIENLGGGVYRRKASAIVTDNEGNPVPDGTKVFLNVIDTILAQGTITSEDGDGISAGILTDVNPTLADGDATTFGAAYAVRNGTYHFIHAGDHAFLTSSAPSYEPSLNPNSYAEDKNRVIESWTANTMTMTSDYSNAYPNATYASGVTDYVVGVSALGAEVLGKDATATESTGTATDSTADADSVPVTTSPGVVNEGYGTTVNGVAEFYISYPANVDTIRTGCIASGLDARVAPLHSARLFLVASAGTEATTIDQRFCFSSISPWTLSSIPSKIGEGTNSVNLWLNDGGDEVSLAYTWISAFAIIDKGDITVNFTNSEGAPFLDSNGDVIESPSFLTGRYGSTTVGVEIIDNSVDGSGGSVTIEFYSSGEATLSYDVAIEDTSAP